MTREEIFQELYHGETVYPPPLEDHSALLEVTRGCSWRKCKFCDFPKDGFSVVPMSELTRKVELLRQVLDGRTRLHLLGCNPFCLPTDQLLNILALIRDRLPQIRDVSMYARADDVLKKTPQELSLLCKAGATDLHIGLESGSDLLLSLHDKGETVADMDAALDKLDRAGIRYYLTVIPGLGGHTYSREHAEETAAFLNRHRPMSIWCIGLKVWPDTPLDDMVKAGDFSPMTYREMLAEERYMLSLLQPRDLCLYVDSTVLGKYSIVAALPEQQASVLQQMDRLLAQNPE